LIIYNHTARSDSCPEGTGDVGGVSKGIITKDIVERAVFGISNVVSRKSLETTWNDVQAIWAPNLPHVIVHVNAGYYLANGPYLPTVFSNAAAKGIGIVSVGDDAGHMGDEVFGFTNTINIPLPMRFALQYNQPDDKLWIALDSARDVPQEPGIITNALRYLLSESQIDFKPVEANGRCQADADKYDIAPDFLHQLSFMGHQRAYDASSKQIIGGPTELSTIAAFGNKNRRGVALSYQPQYLAQQPASDQIIYDAIMWASYAHEGFKVDNPIANPASKTFAFVERVALHSATKGAELYYRLGDSGPFSRYPDIPIEITKSTMLQAFGEKAGYFNSDTITENYTKTSYASVIEVSKYRDDPLGGLSVLNENDVKFIIKLSTPYASLSSVSISISSSTAQDDETIIVINPQNTGSTLEFIDTLDFMVGTALSGNGRVEAFAYDLVTITWKNPLNSADKPTASFFVRPDPNPGTLYFADEQWRAVTLLTGNETLLYVVVEDQIWDPSRLNEYVVTLTNTKGDNNTSLPDKETFQLLEISPGTYGIRVPVSLSTRTPPVEPGNGFFEIRRGDDLKAIYIDPIDKMEASDSKGFGVPNQQPGQITFTNEDFITPASLTTSGKWDASRNFVYLHYQDDYVAAIPLKSAKITISSFDGRKKNTLDTEMVNMVFAGQQEGIGNWIIELPLDDSPWSVPGDEKLQFYFNGEIQVEVATHRSGTAVKEAGDTARAVIEVAYNNQKEHITIKEAISGTAITRHTTSVQICVADQVFSKSITDTLYLDKVECKTSGDRLESIVLLQAAPNAMQYCGTIEKGESLSGTLIDDVLHCQSIDDVVAHYRDPVYGTETNGQETIIDGTVTSIQFREISGSAIVTSFEELTNNQLIVQLVHATPRLDVRDTLSLTLKTDAGDILEVLVIETARGSGVFEAVVNIGFSEYPDKANNILEGLLNTDKTINHMTLTGLNEWASTSITINSAYVPVEKSWIVDGNNDGHADSIYIRFKGDLPELPTPITSIDWPFEAAQHYTAVGETILGEKVISRLADHPRILAVLLPGSMDKQSAVFPAGATSMYAFNPPLLTLPEGKLFQHQEVLIEDGIGAAIVSAYKYPSDNTFYKNIDGYLKKQPDTLVITLSEKIRAVHTIGTPWDSLFMFMSPYMEKSTAYPLRSQPGVKPEVKGPDSLVWTFVISNEDNLMKPLVGDAVFMHTGASYVDASPNANRPGEAAITILGPKSKNPIKHSTIFVPVLGVGLNDPRSLTVNIHMEQNGQVVPGRDVISVLHSDGTSEYQRVWVKPIGLQGDGSVLPPYMECGRNMSEANGQTEFPENCLSTVKIISTDAYMAEISIFDHLGKFVHQSVQYFGYCREMENHHRRSPSGLQSWLVWNQRDPGGDYVGTGVYIWKVKFTTNAGQHTAIYRQGVVRSYDNPTEYCAQ
ncbi:MAG: hypothetical protein HQK83_17930, partial [Fibrobacteria bacterium]|nr:hypothetical protein [Fibrobacteria bacterium]